MATRVLVDTSDVNNDGTVVDGDSIFFASGTVSATTNTDHSALGVNGLSYIRSMREWKGDIGTSANPLKAEVSAAADSIADFNSGGGRIWFHADGNADHCDKTRMRGIGELNLVGGGTHDVVECSSGVTNIANAVTATTLRVAASAFVHATNTGTAPDITTLEVGGGVLYCYRRIATSATIWGGTCRFEDEDATMGAFTLLNVEGGNFQLVRSGTITTLNWRAGLVDVTALYEALTITTLNVWAHMSKDWIERLINHPLVTVGTVNYIITSE